MDSDEEELRRYERDLFGDEDDADADAEDVHERSREGRVSPSGSIKSDEEDRQSQAGAAIDENAKDAKKVKPKKTGPINHIVLSEDVLCGKNGLKKIEEVFKDFKFEGKGREQRDLDRVLHKLENWVHIMYPRFPFGQTLERIEFLGLKKPTVKTYRKKMRMGLITSNDAEVDELLKLDENNISTDEEEPADAFENIQRQLLPQPSDGGIPSDDDFPFIDEDELENLMNPSARSPQARPSSPIAEGEVTRVLETTADKHDEDGLAPTLEIPRTLLATDLTEEAFHENLISEMEVE